MWSRCGRGNRQIEPQAGVLGELDERQQVDLPAAPERVALRGAVLSALTPYPEVGTAVAVRLTDWGNHG